MLLRNIGPAFELVVLRHRKILMCGCAHQKQFTASSAYKDP